MTGSDRFGPSVMSPPRRLGALLARGLLVLALAGAALSTGQFSAAANAGQARQTDAGVRIEVDLVAPRVPAPGGTLVLAGRVVNDSSEPLQKAELGVRRTTAPLASRSQLASVAAGQLAP